MKAINIITAIISLAALVGDIAFMYVLLAIGEAVSSFTTLITDPDLQGVGQTFSTALLIGWIWAILVLAACILAIKLAVFDNRKKK